MLDAARAQRVEQRGREVQPGRGRGHAAPLPRVDRLVAGAVFRAVGPADVGRQGHVAGTLEGGLDGSRLRDGGGPRRRPSGPTAAVSTVAVKVASMATTAPGRSRRPGRTKASHRSSPTSRRRKTSAVPPPWRAAEEAGGEHAAPVDDQEVARAQEARQVAEDVVGGRLRAAGQAHEARVVARLDRLPARSTRGAARSRSRRSAWRLSREVARRDPAQNSFFWPGSAFGQGPAEVLVGAAGGDAAARRAVEEADLQQVGLVDVLDGVRLLADGRGQRAHAHRARRRTCR